METLDAPPIQVYIDRLLARYDGSSYMKTSPDLKAIGEWLTRNQNDVDILCQYSRRTLIAVIPSRCMGDLTDDNVREDMRLVDGAAISDELRLKAMRRQMALVFRDKDNVDDEGRPPVLAIRLRSTRGRVANLWYAVGGWSMAGVEFTWLGLYRNTRDAKAAVRRLGWCFTLRDYDALSRRARLALWPG